MGNDKSLTEDIKKMGSNVFEKIIHYLKTHFPSYDLNSNSIRIPEKNLEAFVQFKGSEIPEIKNINLECRDGYIHLNINGIKGQLVNPLNLKCFIERFEISKSSQIAVLRFEAGNGIYENQFIFKMALMMAQGLISGLVEKRIQDVSEAPDNIIRLDWPRAKIFLSDFPLIKSLSQKTIMGINIFDFITIEKANVIEGFVTVVPEIYVKPSSDQQGLQ